MRVPRRHARQLIRGVNVFPAQSEAALLKVQGLAPQYTIFVDPSKAQLDSLEACVEASPDRWGQGDFVVKATEQIAKREVYEMLGIHASAVAVEPRKLERSLGKAVRVMGRLLPWKYSSWNYRIESDERVAVCGRPGQRAISASSCSMRDIFMV